MTPPVFFSDVGAAGAGDVIVLSGDEGRHAADVRRLRVGEPVDLTAGAGIVLRGVVCEVGRAELSVIVSERVEVAAPQPRLTVVQALARGGRDEQAVESMTEVGVDRVVGWEAARNVAHWTARTQAKWRATAHAAAKQSRRVWWPQVDGPMSTAEVESLCRSAALAVVLHGGAPEPLSRLAFPAGDIVVVVGPEGGITDEELAVLAGGGARAVRLGESVLRSSTAGAAALAVICSRTRWT